MKIVVLEYASALPISIDPADVDFATIADLLPTETTPGLVGCRMSVSGTVFRFLGSSQAMRIALTTALRQGSNAVNYIPTLASSGAGVLALIGGFVALAVRDGGDTFVHVMGSFQFTRAVAGVAETITIGMPTTAGIAPAANFAATADVTGHAQMAGIHAATDFCGPLQATIGAKTCDVAITDNAATSRVDVYFSYKFTNP